MLMLRVVLSGEAQAKLKYLQQNHIHPLIRRRALVLLLRSENTPNDQITNITGLCENAITGYVHNYLNGGIAKLTELKFRKPESKLKPFDSQIKKYFEDNPVATIAQACKEVEKLTGLTLKNTQMRSYFKRIGIKWRKVNSVPAKVNIELNKNFMTSHYNQDLKKLKQGSALCTLSMQPTLF